MKALVRRSIILIVSAILASLSAENTFGQVAKVDADKPDFDDIPSPEFSGGKQKNFKAKEWLEMEIKVKVSLTPKPPSETCEKLMVKWYVLVENPDKGGNYLLLTKDIEHVNVPLNEDVYCSVYLSPASVKRLTGADRAVKRVVEVVGYEVLINGAKVASGTSKYGDGWWNASSPKMKISRSDAVPLLNKSETPFGVMWWDRYAEVAVERR